MFTKKVRSTKVNLNKNCILQSLQPMEQKNKGI